MNAGIFPAVTIYNGFYNLDGYWMSYPLKHKLAFLKIMVGELGKSPENLRYFDGWGSRCKIFAHELTSYGQQVYKKLGIQRVEDLQIDVEQFKNMGGQYILSVVLIGNSQALGLALLKIFEDADSAWKVHLYKVL